MVGRRKHWTIDTWKKCMSYVDSCCHMHLLPYVSAAGKVRVSKGPEGSGLLYLLLNAYNLWVLRLIPPELRRLEKKNRSQKTVRKKKSHRIAQDAVEKEGAGFWDSNRNSSTMRLIEIIWRISQESCQLPNHQFSFNGQWLTNPNPYDPCVSRQ